MVLGPVNAVPHCSSFVGVLIIQVLLCSSEWPFDGMKFINQPYELISVHQKKNWISLPFCFLLHPLQVLLVFFLRVCLAFISFLCLSYYCCLKKTFYVFYDDFKFVYMEIVVYIFLFGFYLKMFYNIYFIYVEGTCV